MAFKKEEYTVGPNQTIEVNGIPMCRIEPLGSMSIESVNLFTEALVKVLNSHTYYIENSKKF
jgi:hypothetical protein